MENYLAIVFTGVWYRKHSLVMLALKLSQIPWQPWGPQRPITSRPRSPDPPRRLTSKWPLKPFCHSEMEALPFDGVISTDQLYNRRKVHWLIPTSLCDRVARTVARKEAGLCRRLPLRSKPVSPCDATGSPHPQQNAPKTLRRLRLYAGLNPGKVTPYRPLK